VLYDTIGRNYRTQRIADPRIEAAILEALGDSSSVVNVGAGAGSYEPPGRTLVAVEPAVTMLRQRPGNAAPAVRAVAEHLPLRDKCVDAALAVLTLHHWQDLARGLQELRRIARDRVVILTYDPFGAGFWLTAEYFPAIAEKDRLHFPPLEVIAGALGGASVQALPVPKDCTDGFLGAYWSRPHAYLEPAVRSGMSAFADLEGLDEGLHRLRSDLDSGRWQQRFGTLMQSDELDIGYRLVVSLQH
jgi:SAM-dependent methyltransferase